MFGATTDNGQIRVNAIELLGLEHFPCLAHTLQLAIKKVFTIPWVNTAIARCKKLVEYFNKSTKETYRLREKQKMLQIEEHNLKVSYHQQCKAIVIQATRENLKDHFR